MPGRGVGVSGLRGVSAPGEPGPGGGGCLVLGDRLPWGWYGDHPRMVTAVGDTHATGMHSCY